MLTGRIVEWGPDGGAHRSDGYYYVVVPDHKEHELPAKICVPIDERFRYNVCAGTAGVGASPCQCAVCHRSGGVPMYRLGSAPLPTLTPEKRSRRARVQA